MAARFQDPFAVLPIEIVIMILNYLTFKQIVYVLHPRRNQIISPPRFLLTRHLLGESCVSQNHGQVF